MTEWALEMTDITKEFSGVKALDAVSLRVKKGEIHALCGENGAGKSTLMKVLSGVYPHGTFTGDIRVNGKPVQFRGIADSEASGVAIIYQELALVPEFTIAENVFLGKEPGRLGMISEDEVYQQARKWTEAVGLQRPLSTKVKYLGVGEQQLVEIAKALKKRAEILILDEPTAALSEREVERLLQILRELRSRGVTCIYISHKLDEVLSIADTVTVLRDGRSIATKPVSELDESAIISLMVGRNLDELFPKVTTPPGDVVMRVSNWSVTSAETRRQIVRDVSFEVRAGEVVGIAGLVGSGRSELVTSIFGAYPGRVAGDLEIAGEKVHIKDAADAIQKGIGLVTEDRKKQGLVLGMDIRKNITLASLRRLPGTIAIHDAEEIQWSEKLVRDLRIKVPSLEVAVSALSGGNQQKVVIAKWLLTHPKILILDEPTRGIDVGAKYEIYQLMNQLTQQGMAILMISSELPEVLGMSDRILVMGGGRIQGELKREEASQEKIMHLATRGQ
ncbi:xylose import ATP-binding protein XylG [Alicyclobacillus contaminans]|uniref:xylose ABC transporter ATP-binding protein n=1 Tax=Alicyclobacillus contaminans TaxID=392016 RepID=UPI0004271DA2|nr:xylose ABC transporter ATP-binding protein [Alicyclobacillus contaminans]GMA51379.1 xylose import ATP-binding protein XylG [Alicyclobacillus contaminans]